jgi:glucose/arabinose dehydrogenase
MLTFARIRHSRPTRALVPALILAVALYSAGCTHAKAAPSRADAPIADPIPEAVQSNVQLTLRPFVTMPASHPDPAPTTGPLVRHARINYLGEVPDGSGRLFVPDLNGKLYFVKNGKPREYLDVGAQVGPNFWSHKGLAGGFGFVAFHPDFAKNGLFYTVHSEARDALRTHKPDLPAEANTSMQGVLTEWTAKDPSADVFSGTHRELLRLGFTNYMHDFQEIDFNPTAKPGDLDYGLLYIAAGDGGAPTASGVAQDLRMPQGKILRIDPRGTNGANGRYGIPPSNPLLGPSDALGEIYAYGLRNPHRFSWDPGAGHRMFIGSIGELTIESIYDARPGDNFGWSRREGPFVIKPNDPACGMYPLPRDDDKFHYTYPVAAYDHDPPRGFPACKETGQAVIGGFVYRGHDVPELCGKYLLGDDVTGDIFYVEASEMHRGSRKLPTMYAPTLLDETGKRVTMQELAGDERVDLRFGRDGAGELYVLSKANGRIWKITGTGPGAACADGP